MGYKITYDHRTDVGYHKRITFPKARRVAAGIIISLIIFCALIKPLRTKIMDIIFPGDWAVTESAFDSMVQNINSGSTFYDAVAVFCQEIIDESKVS